MKKARKPTVPSPSADPQSENEGRLSKRALALKEELRRAVQHAAQPQLDSLTPNGHMTVATVAG